MSVTIDYTQFRTIIEGPKYQIETTVTYVAGIAREIFVMNTELGTFEHVATVWDMEHVVPSRDQAILEGRGYYRDSACMVVYDTDLAAIEFTEYTKDRVQDLVTKYARAVGEFTGTVNYHIENAP